MNIYLFGLTTFIWGFVVGGLVMAIVVSRSWAANANDYKRLEYKGRLYKVTYADQDGGEM